MKPRSILLFLFSVFVGLFLLVMVFPKQGITIATGLTLWFPTLSELLNPTEIHYADIDKIVSPFLSDSLSVDSIPSNTRSTDINMLRVNTRRMEFPNNDTTLLFQLFRHFVEARKTNQSIHVLHYGDSQLEGDRISGYIRSKLQALFGGGGPGLISVTDIVTPISVKKSHSPNWKRYTLYGKVDSSVRHTNYGSLMSFSRFSPVNDSLLLDSIIYSAWVKLSPAAGSKRFSTCRLFYGNCYQNCILEWIGANNNVMQTDTLKKGNGIFDLIFTLPKDQNEIVLNFTGLGGPDVYGISLEDGFGIYVDNIPMRGSSGLEFTKQDASSFSTILKKLNTRLVILQFGINVVPTVIDDYSFYENALCNQLKYIKKICPEVTFVVIGLSDMSRKGKDGYESFPNIEKIRDAQRNAAFRAGGAFWDLYEAMGGKNSMPSWVHAKPSLAEKDFTHFNFTGAQIVAEMFCNALMFEYHNYNKTIQ